MFCPKCGHKNPEDAAFCMKCGLTITAQAPAAPLQGGTPPASPPTTPAAPAAPAWQATPQAGAAGAPSAPPGWGAPAGPAWQAHPAPHVSPQAAQGSPMFAHQDKGPGHLAPEQQVWQGTMSWKGLLNFGWLLGFIIPLPVIVYAFSMRAHFGHGSLWMISLLSLLPLTWFFIKLLILRTTQYRITTDRISVLKGVLSRESDDLQLIRVADVQFFQSLLARLLNVGDIRVLSTDKTVPDLVIPGVSSPAEFKEMLWNLVRERRRNLVAMEQLNSGIQTPPPMDY